MKFTVYQFHLSREAMKHLNTVGWSGDFGDYPEIAIELDVKRNGLEEYQDWMNAYYIPVAVIEGVDDLEDVFAVGNSYQTVGSTIRRVSERMHSVSVGDVIRNDDSGEVFMVEPEGFAKLDVFGSEE
jgi:hypothetical protein